MQIFSAVIPTRRTTSKEVAMDIAKENRKRAARCLKAIHRYDTDSNSRTCLIDFLTDAMHWCRLKGHDFHDVLDRASEHFAAEVFDENVPDVTINPQRKEPRV
jgi:hypothetical protein